MSAKSPNASVFWAAGCHHPVVQWFAPRSLLRDWGKEIIIAETPTYCGKILKMNAGTRGGLQYHVKEESHYLVSGTLRLRWADEEGLLRECLVNAGTAWHVPPGAVHQEEAVTDVVTFEVSDPLVEDRVRVEERYGLGGGEQGLRSTEVTDQVEQFCADLTHKATCLRRDVLGNKK